ncbi:endonuclease G, mitochondrial-like [Porites lutea]|uniref:endonuclease G, mitochondrial-like n=1 Tax=Porites lutea TaxID=51062 RepID=UPI003CC6B993
MSRRLLPVVSIAAFGTGGILAVLFERKRQQQDFLPVVHAKRDVVDGGLGQSRQSEIMRFGYPSFENIKAKNDYVLSYNRRLRLANWVAEHLTARNVYNRDLDRGKCDFAQDPTIHPLFSTSNEDYRMSGYDRGHLAAAANHRSSQDSMCATFFLSNMSPQVGSGFNRDAWEHLEKYSRHLTRFYKNVYVITGPLFLPKLEADNQLYVKYKLIGINRIAVPTHFFKIILGETNDNQLEMQSYILPNQPINEKTPLHMFQVPTDTIEKASGLIVFDKVPRHNIKQIRPTIPVSS